MTPRPLSKLEVLCLHHEQLKEFGGAAGLRDEAALEPAIYQPMATFGGELLHKDLVEIAAAYLFYLVCDHPCVDGNKRIGLAAALAFLRKNKHPVTHGTESLYALTMLVANGQLTKQQVTDRLRAIIDAPEAP